MFLVSNLKEKLGAQDQVGIDLPTLNDIDNIIPIPQAILDLCVKRRKEVPMYSQGCSNITITISLNFQRKTLKETECYELPYRYYMEIVWGFCGLLHT